MSDRGVDLSQLLRRGTLLIIETGEYSDRNWFGPVRMLKDIIKADLAQQFRADWKPDPNTPWDNRISGDGFLPWLILAGYAEQVDDVHSWHVGSYGDFEP